MEKSLLKNKVCRKCKIEKPISNFYKSNKGDGYQYYCKECFREINKIRHRTPHRKEYNRRWRKEHHYEQRVHVKKYKASLMRKYAKDPKLRPRHLCRWAFNRLIKAGLIKKEPCILCGEKAEGHHPDYNKPFKVIWLCPVHHREWHSLAKEQIIEIKEKRL